MAAGGDCVVGCGGSGGSGVWGDWVWGIGVWEG